MYAIRGIGDRTINGGVVAGSVVMAEAGVRREARRAGSDVIE
jgi:hypothetical protein